MRPFIPMFAASVLTLNLLAGPATADEPPVEDILLRFVHDYAADPMQATITFGIEIDGKRWHVASDREAGTATLEAGFPDRPMFYFTTTGTMLERIDRGAISGLTAMAAEHSGQLTPLDVLPHGDYQRTEDYDRMLRPLIFHFWTRGQPETVPLGVEHSRVVHGAPGTVMYYADGFRSAVYNVPPGLGRDQAPTMTIPFPRVLVVMSGTMTGTVGGHAFSIEAGNMVFIPPGVAAQVWNDRDVPLQMMFLMFGDGA